MTMRYKYEPLYLHPGVRLNLGCGRDVRSGFVNVDKIDLHTPGRAFIQVDVEKELLSPFIDDQFDYILARDFLNHLPHRTQYFDGEFWNLIVDEMMRVSKNGAVWELIHPCRPASLENGGHCRIVGVGSFNYWLMGEEMGSLEAQEVRGSLRLRRKENIRPWPDPRAIFWRIVLEVVK